MNKPIVFDVIIRILTGEEGFFRFRSTPAPCRWPETQLYWTQAGQGKDRATEPGTHAEHSACRPEDRDLSLSVKLFVRSRVTARSKQRQRPTAASTNRLGTRPVRLTWKAYLVSIHLFFLSITQHFRKSQDASRKG